MTGDHLAIDNWESGNLGAQGTVVTLGPLVSSAGTKWSGESCGHSIRCEPGQVELDLDGVKRARPV
jgi:hypothetical protein